ncbi:putative isomerase [Cladobotryum mycophilum]|uniref:Isomerase n=1 Tax=Cladobotryum mycophilum TaxID=491253 RepID=A0ABR0SCE1_9HYPO
MADISYAIVDVFSTTPYKGNPLAVVDNVANSLTDTQMKLIARQFNLSETTFFSPPSQPKATYRLQSFLPDGKEVFGAGHNILGVWWFLAHDGRLDFSQPKPADENGTGEFVFYQELGNEVSAINIWRKTGMQGRAEFTVLLRQAPPNSHSKHPDPSSLATSLGLENRDIGLEVDGLTLPKIMSTSTTRHLIVPVASVAALEKVVVQRDKLL